MAGHEPADIGNYEDTSTIVINVPSFKTKNYSNRLPEASIDTFIVMLGLLKIYVEK